MKFGRPVETCSSRRASPLCDINILVRKGRYGYRTILCYTAMARKIRAVPRASVSDRWGKRDQDCDEEHTVKSDGAKLEGLLSEGLRRFFRTACRMLTSRRERL
jgi:hypothetical protein